MEVDRQRVEDRRIDSLLLERSRDFRGVVPAQDRLQPDVGDLRALPRRVVVLLDSGRCEYDADVHLLFRGGGWVVDPLQLQAGCAEQCVESGWDVARIADRVGLCRSPSRNLGDHEQNGGRRQNRQRDRDQRPAIAEDLVDLFSEDDSQRAHYFTASTRDRNESSRS